MSRSFWIPCFSPKIHYNLAGYKQNVSEIQNHHHLSKVTEDSWHRSTITFISVTIVLSLRYLNCTTVYSSRHFFVVPFVDIIVYLGLFRWQWQWNNESIVSLKVYRFCFEVSLVYTEGWKSLSSILTRACQYVCVTFFRPLIWLVYSYTINTTTCFLTSFSFIIIKASVRFFLTYDCYEHSLTGLKV